jgi:FkbM family methyltransferase
MKLDKTRMEEAWRERLFGSRIFPAARTAYQFFFNRAKLTNRRELRRFFSEYIHGGDLVFDVGANVGIYTEIFAALGAEVVAVEPNPRCCKILQQLARRLPIHVEMCAAGDSSGTMTFQVCENHCLSTVAESVNDAAKRSPVHRAANWTGTLEVEVKTLDQLAERYGVPCFVKIDAEGFDDRVLRGMSFQPSAVSFEYYRYLPEVALRCLETPILATGYVFNYFKGLGMHSTAENWMERSELRARLEFLVQGEDFGDVIAHRNPVGTAHATRTNRSSGNLLSHEKPED